MRYSAQLVYVDHIDLVCVDMYPLEKEIARAGNDLTSIIELTDIGGPTMLRSAVKGQRPVICDPADRQLVLDWMSQDQPDHDEFVETLCAKAEFVVARYVLASATYRGRGKYDGLVLARLAE